MTGDMLQICSREDIDVGMEGNNNVTTFAVKHVF